MRVLSCLIAACVSALAIGDACANTYDVFDVSGAYTDPSTLCLSGGGYSPCSFGLSGTLKVDVTTGTFSEASITQQWAYSWSILFDQGPVSSPGVYELQLQPTSGISASPVLLSLFFAQTPAQLADLGGGSIVDGTATCRYYGGSIQTCATDFQGNLTLETSYSTDVSPVPLPSVGKGLPGLVVGASLFVWWHKRRKNQAAV